MGCGLRKMKPPSEESPGKIYSTLKRPQVETKVGVAYTYRYLDFLIGKDGGTSTLRLSSVRELPEQLQELYQQGFVLAAVHPFIHPCGPESNSPQHQLYRSVLVRQNDGVDRSQSACPPYKLQLEECLSAEQLPSAELIQGYVKKQIQDAADQGVMFVGFIQEPYGAPCTTIREPDTPSLSLHSSPSSVLGSLGSRSPSSHPSSPIRSPSGGPNALGEAGKEEVPTCPEAGGEARAEEEEKEEENQGGSTGNHSGSAVEASPISEVPTEDQSPSHNNNQDRERDAKDRPRYRVRRGNGVDLLALYNHPPVREGQAKYYTVKVPLRVQECAEGGRGVRGVQANWLDHMTQHFNNGASLVDGYFHLGSSSDVMPKSLESVFIFQEGSESEPNTPTYDAIVVEQWTIIDGLQVKADYVPLLQSLATFGWRLTCVLPTPVVKTNSDGSLSTKQIVFLQRPVLGRKKRESKKLIFKPRGKSNNKNYIKETAKNKKKKKAKMDTDDPKIQNDRGGEAERTDDGRADVTEGDAATGNDTSQQEVKCDEVTKMAAGTEISSENKDGGAASRHEEETGNGSEEMECGEESKALDGEQENGELSEKVPEVTEIVVSVEQQSETKEKEEVEAVIENGVETDEERGGEEEGEEEEEEKAIQHKMENQSNVEVVEVDVKCGSVEVVADSTECAD